MKIQILLDGQIVNTQIVSELLMGDKATLADFKRQAMRAALEDRAIRISESLRASFVLFDTMSRPLMDDEKAFASNKYQHVQSRP
ncbi:MAG: hypothetical protein ABIQ30_14935 [Devosia sp.]